jgi:GDPmannose 4,6-dehydratase
VRALITGIHGQDSWYLAEYLNSKGYEVIGTRRGNEEPGDDPPNTKVVFGDVTDAQSIREVVETYKPDEIYNLAAITHVGDSFSAMATCFQVNAVGAANCLDAAARTNARFYQASTSELYGDSPPPQWEGTEMRPRSPYAVAKHAAYWLTRNYRERGVHASNGILFNHESPRRGGGFVTQKVCRAVADIYNGKQEFVTLGNLDAMRDWGHAKDFVKAMWLMLQQEEPDDYVVATGRMLSIRDLCKTAFSVLDLDYRRYVKSSQEFYRPLEVERLCGDPTKIKAIGWEPEIEFEDMIAEMVNAALKR